MTAPAEPLGRLGRACQELADSLTAAGVRATLNRASLEVPGAWVRPDNLQGTTTLGGWTATHTRASVLLVAPQAGDLEALTDLEGLLAVALSVIDPAADVDTSVVLPHNGNALPAFRLPVDLELEE